MNNIIQFNFHEKEIRTIQDEDGNPWFIAKDVCETLGIKNPTQAIEFLDDDERSMFNIGRQGDVNIISESGLYGLIGKSRKKEAKDFQRWLRKEVLPAIRKTGSYTTSQVDKESFELQIMGIEACARMLNYSESSKLELIHSVHENNGVPTASLPVYTPAVRVTFSASDLLKKNNCELSALAFNKLMLANRLLEERERTASKGKIKKFKALTDTGLVYGQNDASKQNPRAVHPHYFEDTFMDLFKLITQEDEEVV